MTEEDLCTVKAMDKYGGNFVKALAEASLHADPINLNKLKNAFPEYYKQYREMSNY